jgi:hypothetical protein
MVVPDPPRFYVSFSNQSHPEYMGIESEKSTMV